MYVYLSTRQTGNFYFFVIFFQFIGIIRIQFQSEKEGKEWKEFKRRFE